MSKRSSSNSLVLIKKDKIPPKLFVCYYLFVMVTCLHDYCCMCSCLQCDKIVINQSNCHVTPASTADILTHSSHKSTDTAMLITTRCYTAKPSNPPFQQAKHWNQPYFPFCFSPNSTCEHTVYAHILAPEYQCYTILIIASELYKNMRGATFLHLVYDIGLD